MSIRRITEDEVQALWVQRLPDTPNRTARFGTAGLSARELKAAYDALPLRIVERFNEVVDLILENRLAALITTPQGKSLADFFREVTSGELSAYLTVDGKRTLTALAAALDTHDHRGIYAELSEGGRLSRSLLPPEVEGLFSAEAERLSAEAARTEAEAARAEAEALRTAAAEAAERTVAAMEAAEAEREAREAAREGRMKALEEGLAAAAADAEEAARLAEGASGDLYALSHSFENLAAAAQGRTHVFSLNTDKAYRKAVPEGALPYARIQKLGGAEAALECNPMTAIVSHGANLLPYPYPAAESTAVGGLVISTRSDGGLLVSGYAYEEIYYPLYTTDDALALPVGDVYVEPSPYSGVELYVETADTPHSAQNGAVTIRESDGLHGRYYVYLKFLEGSSFTSAIVYPAITRGAVPRPGVRYHPPIRYEIPEEIRALNGYGFGVNYLDFENRYYYLRAGDDGNLLPAIQYLPLPDAFLAECWLSVEAGGELVFENSRGENVRSEILFGIQL